MQTHNFNILLTSIIIEGYKYIPNLKTKFCSYIFYSTFCCDMRQQQCLLYSGRSNTYYIIDRYLTDQRWSHTSVYDLVYNNIIVMIILKFVWKNNKFIILYYIEHRYRYNMYIIFYCYVLQL